MLARFQLAAQLRVDEAVVGLQQLDRELDAGRRGEAHLPLRYFGLELPFEACGLHPDGVDAGARLGQTRDSSGMTTKRATARFYIMAIFR